MTLGENKHTLDELRQLQSLPLKLKNKMTQRRIRDWYTYWGGAVYVSFSGGKDSTVLADICARLCKLMNIPLYLVFVNTGLEYPEIQKHVNFFSQWLRDKYGIEVVLEILRPKMRFDEVVKQHGYPIIGKDVSHAVHYAKIGRQWAINYFDGLDGVGLPRVYKKNMYSRYKPIVGMDFGVSDKCCMIMKETPLNEYSKNTGKKPIVAIMACESERRETAWLQTGCNAFDSKKPMSKPMSFWTEQDVLQYIKEEQIPIASVYGEIDYAENAEQMSIDDFGIDCGRKLCTTGCKRTGCIFCAFGAHLEKGESRFERLKRTHPRQYEYCIGGGEYVDGIWQPNKNGLGMGHVFDELNKIYGEGFIRY